MDENAESSSTLHDMVQPETDFTEFFYGIISKLYDLKNRQMLNDVKSVLKEMKRLKNETDSFHKSTYFSFKLPQVRCAYLYAYSVLHSIMVYSEFSNLLKQSETSLLPACRRGSLKICCLGDGPGIDAVAICRSIYDIILEPYLANTSSLLDIHFTVIDKNHLWRREESFVVNEINDSSHILHSNRILLHSDFLKADLHKPFKTNLKEKIMEADIVTVLKLTDAIQESFDESCDRERQLMMENIIESMREDSCLFILNTIGEKVFDNTVKFLRDKGPHSRFKTSIHKDYNLDMRTIKKFEDMMKLKKDPNYHLDLLIVKSKVSACMWIKTISVTLDNIIPNGNNVCKTSSITNLICSTVQGEKDVSSVIPSSSAPKTSNGDKMNLPNIAQNTKPTRKSNRARRKKMERKINNAVLSMIVSIIVLSMLVRGHS